MPNDAAMPPVRDYTMATYKCPSCLSAFGVKKLQAAPVVVKGPVHCPFCGATPPEWLGYGSTPYWESFATSLGLGPDAASLIEELYGMWDPTNGDPIRFRDYVRATIDS